MSSRVGGAGPGPSDSRTSRPNNYIHPLSSDLLPSNKIQQLVEEVSPGEQLDKDVEDFLQEHVEEFVQNVTEFACRLARHRKSRVLEARDVQLHLEKDWNIRVPGYGDDPFPARRNTASAVHTARLQAIAKTQSQAGGTPGAKERAQNAPRDN